MAGELANVCHDGRLFGLMRTGEQRGKWERLAVRCGRAEASGAYY
jgi:hypothetical protein